MFDLKNKTSKGVVSIAIIPQRKLFGWTEIQSLGDLERLRLVLDYLPGEELMVKPERMRKNGRNDYPAHAMWEDES